jgi:hypothetical protein
VKKGLLWLLRLLFRLLVFALTGEWTEAMGESEPSAQRAQRPRVARPSRPRRTSIFTESDSSDMRVRSAPPGPLSAAPPVNELGAALRNPRVLRNAVVLGALLGTGRPGVRSLVPSQRSRREGWPGRPS